MHFTWGCHALFEIVILFKFYLFNQEKLHANFWGNWLCFRGGQKSQILGKIWTFQILRLSLQKMERDKQIILFACCSLPLGEQKLYFALDMFVTICIWWQNNSTKSIFFCFCKKILPWHNFFAFTKFYAQLYPIILKKQKRKNTFAKLLCHQINSLFLGKLCPRSRENNPSMDLVRYDAPHWYLFLIKSKLLFLNTTHDFPCNMPKTSFWLD